ncbi:MAG: CehA/McbA family metallohydrolase [Deltaproteobacteria bacterium]|nr:CehA/McbA family metallohydrolase [Deltaproteobacteria bacterium]
MFLEPGDYRLAVSHGPEYSAYVADVTATSGGTVTVNAVVAQVVETPGFISGDFHVHSIDSVDAAIPRRDRILSMLGVGIDFFTPSDHEFRADFTQDVIDLGVSSLISTAVGNEVTPFDYGHLGGFPVQVDPSQVNGGAVDWGRAAPAGQDFPSFGNYGLGPGEIFAAIQSDPGEQTVHINHVASFFDGGLHFDTGFIPPISTGDPSDLRLDPAVLNYWDDGFTALELWIQTSRSQDARVFGQNFGNWFNLLNQGRIRTGFGDSDTHHLVRSQAGYPRTYLASPIDAPGSLGAIAETLAGSMNDGLATSTNGPFMSISAEGDAGELGGLGFGDSRMVRTTGGSATLTVDVQSPPWAEFDTIQFYVNSETVVDTTGRGPLPPLYRSCPDVVRTASADFTVNSVPVNGASRLEASTTLSLTGLMEDTWVVAVVRGSDDVSCPLFPVLPNDIDPTVNATVAGLRTCDLGDKGVMALAFSNPIFFDVDGDGVFDPPGLRFQLSCP